MKTRLVCILIGTLIFVQISFAQTKESLEKDKIKNLKDIELANDLLKEASENKKKSVGELRIISRRLGLRQELINNIEKEIGIIEESIVDKEKVIASLNNDLTKKQAEYEQLIIIAFKKNSEYTDLMYILAASDINKAYKRYRYLKRLSEYRKNQARLIEEIKRVQEQKLLELTVTHQEKEVLLLQKTEELARLRNEKSLVNDVVSDLSKRERELRGEVKRKEKILKNIEAEIEKIIELEARKSANRSFENLTPTERIVSEEFSKNRGKLPWPTKKGIVTSKFGIQNHPVLRGVKMENNGIDITSVGGSDVNCIFDGTVSVIAAIPGGNYAVIIRHGSYYSVYQNLVKVSVKKGDKVKIGQRIGVVYAEKGNTSGILHFEIRENLKKLNPELWLAK